MDCTITILILKSSSVMIWLLYSMCKLGELWFSNTGVYESERYTPRHFFV